VVFGGPAAAFFNGPCSWSTACSRFLFPAIRPSPRKRAPRATGLTEFIAGPENRLAGFAVQSVLDKAASQYNPLVIYGPTGAGKSHLALGLAGWWQKQHPQANVVYLPAADFAERYADAVETDTVRSWRDQLRAASLFVLEDIGHLAGKRSAQSELWHTLDAIWQQEGLVVVTSRHLPAQMTTLIPALRSRLTAGLSVPLSLPGPGARRMILERLAAARGTLLPKRAAQTLADGLDLSAPALLGALLELEMTAGDSRGPIDAQRVRSYMAGHARADSITLRTIAVSAAKYFGLKLSELKSPRRRQHIVAARGVAMYLSRELTGKSLEQIGIYFGGRDHTTVMHGCRRTADLLKHDPATGQAVADLRKLLLDR